MEGNVNEEIMFSESITFTDLDDIICPIDLEQSLSCVRDYLSSQNAEQRTLKKNTTSQLVLSQVRSSSQKDKDISLSRSVISSQQTGLCHWGLPPEILEKYAMKGITNMFQWQVECLGNPKVINEDGNLVYSAPTSAGKTLVAEILTIKTVLERQKKVIIILPFVSVVREKMFYFQNIFSGSGIRVEGYMGSYSPPGGFQAVHVAVCTIEKANNLINAMLENTSISDLGAVVVDELHLLGDPHRGYLLELLLTKLLYMSRRADGIHIQIIGMSATLPNLPLLSHWLDAHLYKTDFRPIPLIEHCHINGSIYNSNGKLVRTLEKQEEIPNDKDNVIYLSLETVTQGCSVLIFCPSKNWCENLAQQISSSFRMLGYSNSAYSSVLREQLNGSALCQVLEQLKASPVGLDGILHQTISFGVAFHHAGLTMDERDIIESAFKSNTIRVLVATSTLSSGVNLPARRVIVRSPTFCSKPINILTYKQMIGRAGRTGMDTAGESILMCTTNEQNIGQSLISGTLDPVYSCLEGGDKLLRAVLEAIASEVAKTPQDVQLFINCTLLLSSLPDVERMKKFADETIKELVEYELVRLQSVEDGTYYVATALGKACLSSSMAPQDALVLFKELQKARESFVLETDLHMIYLVTPYSICSQWGDVNWMHFLNLWDGLSKAMKRVGELVGIQESLIYRCVRGSVKTDSEAFHNKLKILKRFYTSLALQDLINEVPLSVVATNFNCSRGMLQSLQQSAATFAGMVTAFSRQLGWKSFETLVSQFQDRLQFGIQSELLDLMRLQSLNGVRARALFNSGVETVNQLAVGDACLVENALHSALPFQSEKERDGEMKFDAQQRNSIKNIWITGMKGVTAREAASLLIQEARTYLQYELGVTDMKWKTTEISNFNVTDKSAVAEHSLLSLSCGNPVEQPQAVHQSPENSPLISNQSLNGNELIESPVFLSESLKKFNIYNMTTQLPDNIQTIMSCNADEITLELSSADETSVIIHNSKTDTPSCNDHDVSIKSNCSIFQPDTSKELSMFEESLEMDTQLCKLLDKNKSRKSNDDSVSKQNNNSVLKENNDEITKEIDCVSKEIDTASKEIDSTTKGIDCVSKEIESSSKEIVSASKEIDSTTKDINCVSKEIDSVSKEIDFTINTEMFASNFTSIEKIFDVPFEQTLENANSNRKSMDDVIQSSQEDSCVNSTRINKITTPKRKITKSSQKSNVKRRRFLNAENIFGALESEVIASTPPQASRILTSKNHEKDKMQNLVTKKIKVPLVMNQSSSTLNIIDVTSNLKNYSKYCQDISKHNTFAVFLDFEAERIAPKIGCNIVKSASNNSILQSVKKSYQGKCLRSVSMFVERNTAYYFELKNNERELIEFFITLFSNTSKLFVMYDCKYSFMALYRCLDLTVNSKWEDPTIAEWLLDPEAFSKPLYKMFETYCSIDMKPLLKDKQIMEIMCLNAWATHHTMKQLKNTIQKKHIGLLDTFDKEMKVLRVIAECEKCGMLVDKRRVGEVLEEVKDTQNILEKLAYKLAGQRFNFSSPSSVAKVLGMYNGKKVSTNKKTLEKIDNPLAKIVIYWRKLSAILSKNLFPLTAKATESSKDTRIYGTYWTLTSTGRMSMQEPNLQGIPRNFEILKETFQSSTDNIKESNTYFSCRDMFPSAPGCVLVSADYCQLELRLLAHLCGDATLKRIVSSGQDIFKAIAATWKSIREDEVDDDLRQQAKQMCYGIIYGMGSKSLSQTLDVCELEASVFINTFHSAYPGIQRYIDKVIASCRTQGYVETLSGRRRYLPLINSASFSEKSHAERQAVNTTIQGSAADILKSAMISLFDELESNVNVKLVLLLHDELIFEVPEDVMHDFVPVLRDCMENTVSVSVPLPVKVKTGRLWGSMKELS